MEQENQQESVGQEEVAPAVPRRSNKQKKKKSAFREMAEVVVIALVLAIFIRTFIMENFWIPSRSMVPTIEINDHIMVTKFSYWFSEPERGDVVVFAFPKGINPQEEGKDYVKRLIGLPGEIIEFKGNNLYVNGQLVEQEFLPEGIVTEDYGPITVPEDQYFMCGDNRGSSYDSRVWGFVDRDLIIGKGQFIYWPLSRIGGL